MKKAIVISLVVLLLNSASAFIFAQTFPPATEKAFTAAYDAYVRKTIAMFPDLPGIAIVVIKDDKAIFTRAYGMADREAGTQADADTLSLRPLRKRTRFASSCCPAATAR